MIHVQYGYETRWRTTTDDFGNRIMVGELHVTPGMVMLPWFDLDSIDEPEVPDEPA